MDLGGQGALSQIVIALAVATTIFLLYFIAEQIYFWWSGFKKLRVVIQDKTLVLPADTARTVIQNPDHPSYKDKILALSENQLTGIEFSYTLFVYVSPSTDDLTLGWKTIFYKGYQDGPYPLCGPGVFVSSSNIENGNPTLRVVMNTYDRWYNTIDVNQVPFRKWFHLAVVLRRNTMEVYVNGNLANRVSFKGTLPYQNYQDLQIGSPFKTPTPADLDNTTGNTFKRGIPPGDNFIINGSINGYISRLQYFSYALTYSEIQAAMNIGPNPDMDQDNMDKPPYLIDSWWTQMKG
jgi:hypothetical protein